jgi:hypothetical protein
MYTNAGQEINHENTNEILGDKMTQWFFIEIHLLVGKLVLVMAIHPLWGLDANRHHAPNPQLGAAQPTQNEDPQAMSNPLKMPFVISHGKVSRTPHNHHDRNRRQSLLHQAV